jgi:hypothetical protein
VRQVEGQVLRYFRKRRVVLMRDAFRIGGGMYRSAFFHVGPFGAEVRREGGDVAALTTFRLDASFRHLSVGTKVVHDD